MDETLITNLSIDRLSNGLHLYTNTRGSTMLTSCRLLVNVGAKDDPLDKVGLAHFVEHLVCDFFRKDIRGLWRNIRDSGGYLNATTYYDKTVYIGHFNSDKLFKWVNLISCSLESLDTSKVVIERERNVILSELKAYGSSVWEGVTEEVLGQYAFKSNIIGCSDSIAKISKDDIDEFIDAYYTMDNMAVIAVGSFEKDSLIESLEQSFSRARKTKKAEKDTDSEYCPPKMRAADVRAPHADILFGYRIVCDIKNCKIHACLKLIEQHLTDVLFFYSRQRGYSYSVYIDTMRFKKVSLFYINVRDITKGKADLEKKMYAEIQSLREDLLPQNEFRKIQNNVINDVLSVLHYDYAIAHFYQNSISTFGIGIPLPDLIDEFRKIQPEDVKLVTNEYFVKENGFSAKPYKKRFRPGKYLFGICVLTVIALSLYPLTGFFLRKFPFSENKVFFVIWLPLFTFYLSLANFHDKISKNLRCRLVFLTLIGIWLGIAISTFL